MKYIVALIIIIAALVGGIWGIGFWYDAYLTGPADGAEEIVFQVERGQSVKAISANLEEQGLLESAFPFELYVRFTDAAPSLQAGYFALKPGMSYQGLVASLSKAAAQEVYVTIPEGYTLAQIFEAVSAELEISEVEWQEMTGPDSIISSPVLASIPAGQGLEGYLFPDTYRFRTDADAESVVEIMVSTLEERLSEAGIDPDGSFEQGMNFHEFMTAASILEREVRSPEEMADVADIILKRLKIGMALQMDSTVNYVTGGDSPSISLEDTKLDSPYNTYQRVGLPPGPISNPGLNALRAMANPNPNPYYYFLTSPEGTVHYAITHEEHIANRRFLR